MSSKKNVQSKKATSRTFFALVKAHACSVWAVLRTKPHLLALVVGLLYLIIFQLPFMVRGDNWAEAFYEYVHGATSGGWLHFFEPGIAGYYNFLPKLLSYPYVNLGLPLEYIDYFFRYCVVAYALGCCAFIAHPYNRYLIKNDTLRVLFSLSSLMLLSHITIFSMINVWYIGFIPIILISLSPHRIGNEIRQILYVAFAMAVCLTKPSVILLPLVVYRTWRHKEYLLGFIIIAAITLQTLLFFSSSYYTNLAPLAHTGTIEKILNLLMYPLIVLLKLFPGIPFHPVTLALGGVTVLVCTYLAVRHLGLVRTLLLLAVTGGAVYTAQYPPDDMVPSALTEASVLYIDISKLQREFIIGWLLLLSLFVGLAITLSSGMVRHKLGANTKRLAVGAGILIVVLLYKPIDVTSAGLSIDITPFRSNLASQSIDCMPIPPTALWASSMATPFRPYPWYFEKQEYGTCGRSNYIKFINPKSFTYTLAQTSQFEFTPQSPEQHPRAFAIPVKTAHASQAVDLYLENTQTNERFKAKISARQADTYAYVVFNLSSEKQSHSYSYKLVADGGTVHTGRFTDGTVAHYIYYSLK